MQYE